MFLKRKMRMERNIYFLAHFIELQVVHCMALYEYAHEHAWI